MDPRIIGNLHTASPVAPNDRQTGQERTTVASSDTPTRQGAANPRWQQAAACRGVDVDIFFSSEPDVQRIALETCQSCMIQQTCVEYAVQQEEMFGVWGGTTETSRRRVIREQRRTRRRAQDDERQDDAA